MTYIYAFIVGGIFCVLGELLLLKTKLTSARVLVVFVCAGTVLSAFGVYQPLVDFAGAGATVPLTGFGHLLAQGAIEAIGERGWLGIFTGGLTAASGGIAAAMIFGYIASVIFSPKTKP